jgi:transposase
MRAAGKIADLSIALTGRFTEHHALLCRLHRDRIKLFDDAAAGLEAQIAAKDAPWQRETGLLRTIPRLRGRGGAGVAGRDCPAPHPYFSSHEKLACVSSGAPPAPLDLGRKAGRVLVERAAEVI